MESGALNLLPSSPMMTPAECDLHSDQACLQLRLSAIPSSSSSSAGGGKKRRREKRTEESNDSRPLDEGSVVGGDEEGSSSHGRRRGRRTMRRTMKDKMDSSCINAAEMEYLETIYGYSEVKSSC